MNHFLLKHFLGLGMAIALATALQGQEVTQLDKVLDRIVEQEHAFVQRVHTRTPILETYIQESGRSVDSKRDLDHYFLGRLDFVGPKMYTALASRSDPRKRSLPFVSKNRSIVFDPVGFAQMIFIDAESFNRTDYLFEFVRREFSGGLRCIVFDIAPLDKKAGGRFIGRIWVEEHDLQIVRFNGTYTHSSPSKLYFHFDSWRLAGSNGEWIPALIYVEEGDTETKPKGGLSFKAQTRLWGYGSGTSARIDEFTSLAVELETSSRDENISDSSPLENQRSWEHQAEGNILDRLEKGGLLAATGPIDKMLETVVTNLLVTNGLDVNVHCRVMLTTPLETFSVGSTIIISRGLIDVLPDEASLAMVLSGELAHIVLGHRTNTQFAFHNQTMFSDEDLVQRFRFSRKQEEIDAARTKGREILAKSPYQNKLSNAELFLKALSSRAPRFPNLIRANIGNGLTEEIHLENFVQSTTQSRSIEDANLEQIGALPLGSRVKLDPWTNAISLIKVKPIALLSAREKLLFEITPFAPQFTRAEPQTGRSGTH